MLFSVRWPVSDDPRIAFGEWDEDKHPRDEKGRFASGDSARFSGESADRKIVGDMPVTIVDPHSNAHKVTHKDDRGREYEGATTHIPTATVRNERGKEFEAFHHTLRSNPKAGAFGVDWTPVPRRPWAVRDAEGRAISRHETSEQATAAAMKAAKRLKSAAQQLNGRKKP